MTKDEWDTRKYQALENLIQGTRTDRYVWNVEDLGVYVLAIDTDEGLWILRCSDVDGICIVDGDVKLYTLVNPGSLYAKELLEVLEAKTRDYVGVFLDHLAKKGLLPG